jgi:hypothetical protein
VSTFFLPEVLVNDQSAGIWRHLLEHPGAADSAQMPNATNPERNAVLVTRVTNYLKLVILNGVLPCRQRGLVH